MLVPEYFEGKTDLVEQYYRQYEDYLLKKIAETLLKAGEVGGKADRYLFILKQLELSNSEIIEKLAKLTKQSQSAVRKVLQGSVMTSFSSDREVLERYFEGDFGPINNPVIVEVMNAEWIKTCGELENLTSTTMNQYHMDVVNLLDQAELRVASGVQSYSSAVCEVLDNYAKSGMIINYPTGARRSLEAAVRCAVVTSMNQTAAQVTNKYIAEGGIKYVLVSAHLGARHSNKGGLYSHDEWQGKAYKIRGSEEGYPNLLESTGYDINPDTGEGQVVNPHGLHGYNCRHSHQPWAKNLRNPWINADGTPKVSTSESQKVYENQQEQRAIEREIRQNKRQLLIKQAQIDSLPADSIERANAEADYDTLAYRLRRKNKAYNEFCEKHDLTKQLDRLKAAGFGRAESRKAYNAAKGVADLAP